MVAEKLSAKDLQAKPLNFDLPSLVDIDVGQMIAQLDIEKEEEKTRQMQELEKEYERQIKIHNQGGEENEDQQIL